MRTSGQGFKALLLHLAIVTSAAGFLVDSDAIHLQRPANYQVSEIRSLSNKLSRQNVARGFTLHNLIQSLTPAH